MNSAIEYNEYPSFNSINAIDLAAEKIAPSWPLDQSIAVNPWWKLKNKDISEVSAKLRFLANIRMLMPKEYYKSLWLTEVNEWHLNEAKKQLDVTADNAELIDYLDNPDPIQHWVHISDFLDSQASHQFKISWREEILQQISNFCAFQLQHNQSINLELASDDGFYKAWRASAIADKGMQILTGEEHLRSLFASLPENINEFVIQHMFDLTRNNVDEATWEDYVYALVLDINGWASWLAYDEWQANLYEKDHPHLLRQLIVIRMAWDWVLWQNTLLTDKKLFTQLNHHFTQQLTQTRQKQLQAQNESKWLWVWHKACEIKFQEEMQHKLISAIHQTTDKPALQAVFCIDVRSARLRSKLEEQHADIETYGFAGFFGLPIAYSTSINQKSRPQLPGLLKPTLVAQQIISTVQSNKIRNKLQKKMSWKLAAESAPSTFGIVESQGLLKVFDLLKRSLIFSTSKVTKIKKSHDDWFFSNENADLTTQDLAALAKAILNGIGLKKPYASTVLIVGHGSLSSNNPHASGLDCGACGGQSGEVNALVVCHLLNRGEIRDALQQDGINIPENTIFVPCLHNTVTDEINVLNEQSGEWLTWLQVATSSCQQQRANTDPQLFKNKHNIQHTLDKKSKDWAQLRPEWGLANNAAFVIAPRAYTRGIDFEGRSFLHDYSWQADENFALLEQIMTAPMIVTNWINLQYYASVTDNQHYGSGNKMLHNVVGGNFGVFEGNGGDLRIGLPEQSLHDGATWRHHPVRLNVYIAAPKNAINLIIQKHTMLKELIENNWLFLFQWDYESKTVWGYNKCMWKKLNENQRPHKAIEIYSKRIEIHQKIIQINGKVVVTDDYKAIG